MARTIAERLREVMDGGNLSISDLTLILGKSRPAVHGWALGREPREVYREEIVRRLRILEKMVVAKKGAPLVPHRVSQLDRRDYLRKLYNAADPQFSRSRSAE